MLVFHWSRPCIRPYDSSVGYKSRGIVEKRCKNAESVKKSPTGWYIYRQDVVTTLIRRRVRDVYCTSCRRSTTTSPKLLTEKLDHKQTSRKDKQTSPEHVPGLCQQD